MFEEDSMTPSSRGPSAGLSDPAILVSLFARLRDGVYVTTKDGEILEANEPFLELLEVSSLGELPRNEASLFPELSRAKVPAYPEGRIVEFAIATPSGRFKTLRHATYAVEGAVSMPGSSTPLGCHYAVLTDVSEWKAKERKLLEEGRRDPLTGCFNRRHLEELKAECARRGEGETWGCIVLDLDGFKELNDVEGHEAGDLALVRLSRFLMRRTRTDEAVVRLGGDEFLLVLYGADHVIVGNVADRLRLAAAREDVAPFSLGWAARQPGEPLAETIRRADTRLLAVKSASGVPRRRSREESWETREVRAVR